MGSVKKEYPNIKYLSGVPILAVLLYFSTPHIVFASWLGWLDEIVRFAGDPFGAVYYGITIILKAIVTEIALVLLKLFNYLFFESLHGISNLLNSQAVEHGWVVLRDLTNIFLIALFIFFAISLIVGSDIASKKGLLVKLLLASLLVNFSALITKIPIDISNVASIYFMSKLISEDAITDGKNPLNNIFGALSISGKKFALDEIKKSGGKTEKLDYSRLAFTNIGLILITLGLIVGVVLAILFMFIRIGAFVILVMVSPIGLMALLLQWPKGIKVIGEKWKKFLLDYCIQFPIILLLFILSVNISTQLMEAVFNSEAGLVELTGELLFVVFLSAMLIITPFLPFLSNIFLFTPLGRLAKIARAASIPVSGASVVGKVTRRVGRTTGQLWKRSAMGSQNVLNPGYWLGKTSRRMRSVKKRIGEEKNQDWFKNERTKRREVADKLNVGALNTNKERLSELGGEIYNTQNTSTPDTPVQLKEENISKLERERESLSNVIAEQEKAKRDLEDTQNFGEKITKNIGRREVDRLRKSGMVTEARKLEEKLQAKEELDRIRGGSPITSKSLEKMNVGRKISNLIRPNADIIAERLANSKTRQRVVNLSRQIKREEGFLTPEIRIKNEEGTQRRVRNIEKKKEKVSKLESREKRSGNILNKISEDIEKLEEKKDNILKVRGKGINTPDEVDKRLKELGGINKRLKELKNRKSKFLES